jgi:hypothetical protein
MQQCVGCTCVPLDLPAGYSVGGVTEPAQLVPVPDSCVDGQKGSDGVCVDRRGDSGSDRAVYC